MVGVGFVVGACVNGAEQSCVGQRALFPTCAHVWHSWMPLSCGSWTPAKLSRVRGRKGAADSQSTVQLGAGVGDGGLKRRANHAG